ncbi:hypothetical protein GCM10009416_26260 [Craurococcus roseus]|uniref:DUF2628 domain-containing protein n=1 Tax=Craurococcus roseus TaxID=77585 RepID=A0ABN1FAL1_9PROT
MRIWTVHLPPALDREGRPSRRAPVLVREGFSWGAFLFGPFWLLANRLWLPALLWFVAAGMALLLASAGGVLALPALQFLLGCHARDLRRRALARWGYAQAHVVAEHDEERALERLLAARPELGSAWGRAALA